MVMMTKLCWVVADFQTGGIGALHNHHHSQVTYVQSGEFEMTIGEEVKIIKAGDSYYIPPHVMHGCKCLKAGKLIDVFSPHREDFFIKTKRHEIKRIKMVGNYANCDSNGHQLY